MKANMTNENEEIEARLDKLGRSGIPACVIHFPDGSYDLMPETITQTMGRGWPLHRWGLLPALAHGRLVTDIANRSKRYFWMVTQVVTA